MYLAVYDNSLLYTISTLFIIPITLKPNPPSQTALILGYNLRFLNHGDEFLRITRFEHEGSPEVLVRKDWMRAWGVDAELRLVGGMLEMDGMGWNAIRCVLSMLCEAIFVSGIAQS